MAWVGATSALHISLLLGRGTHGAITSVPNSPLHHKSFVRINLQTKLLSPAPHLVALSSAITSHKITGVLPCSS